MILMKSSELFGITLRSLSGITLTRKIMMFSLNRPILDSGTPLLGRILSLMTGGRTRES